MSDEAKIERAMFKPVKGGGQEIKVHFNPVSLQLSITNTLEEKGQDKKQFVTKSAAKLTMDLIFDTTGTGQDVRVHTQSVAAFMEPDASKTPPIVQFEWGTYKFQGLIESYKETIDFFAPNGVPLRASINLTLSRQEKVFEKSNTNSNFDTQQSLTPEPVEAPVSANQDATSTGAKGGNPQAGRAIAAANNLESMRFSGGASLTVGASVKLSGPVAFASGGAGLGISGGAGVGIGAGLGASAGAGLSIGGGAGASFGAGASASFGAGASASFGAGAGASFGAGAGASFGAGAGASFGGGAGASFGAGAGISIGGSASAGVSASEGAFAGLRTQVSSRQIVSLDTSLLIKRSESLGVATDSGASFSVGGKARIVGSTSLSADVGAAVSLKARIQFED